MQLVLHLNLGDIRVGTWGECQRDLGVAEGIAAGADVEQVIDAAHLLLDHLGDRVFHGFCRGAGIVTGNGHRWRGHCRVLFHRQGINSQGTRHHHDDGDNPGKNRAVNKESGHGFPVSRYVELVCAK